MFGLPTDKNLLFAAPLVLDTARVMKAIVERWRYECIPNSGTLSGPG
jgi:hypothetical protein